MKLLIVGCGSIGTRHCRNLVTLKQEVFVFDRETDRMQNLIDKYKVTPYDIPSQHIEIDAFVICVPPCWHLAFMKEAIKHNSHIFVEKPISNTLDGLDEIIAQAEEKNLIIQVGYQLGFSTRVRAAKLFLTESRLGKLLSIRAEFGQNLQMWHPKEDYRQSYTASEHLGGGIILEASHEIDYVRRLVDSEVTKVSCFAGKLSNLECEVEDTAEINLWFENGVIGNIHVDMIQREYSRWCKLIGETGNMSFHIRRGNQPYLYEMRSFIDCITTGTKPDVDAQTGKRVLEIALACKQSSRENKVMEV